MSPVRGVRLNRNLSPLTGLQLQTTAFPGLRPGLNPVAAPRLNKDAAFAATSHSCPSAIWTSLVCDRPGFVGLAGSCAVIGRAYNAKPTHPSRQALSIVSAQWR